MIRRAFTMRLQPGGLAQYKHWHDDIWPELVAELEAERHRQHDHLRERPSAVPLLGDHRRRGSGTGSGTSRIHDQWAGADEPA